MTNHPHKTKKRDFTLIKLLVAISVIAILVATVIVNNGGGTPPPPLPGEWITVPGNAALGTTTFQVMKFEAKKDANGKATSIATGAPWTEINQIDAIAACQAIGANLITNPQWMTIARNAEQVASNWTGGAVGSGCLHRGNTNLSSPCTIAAYDGANPESGTGRNSLAMFTLSNGQQIWDISGNVWEHVRRDEHNTLTSDLPTDGAGTAWEYIELTNIFNYGELTYDMIRPSNSTWNASHGMGRLLTHHLNTTNRVFFRGGSWARGSNAGAFALSLIWSPANAYTGVGFRCAL